MVRDLSDKFAPLRELQSRERRAQSATPLRNATVSGGQANFIGQETLKVTGSEIVVGLLWIQGPNGELRMSGTLNGDGTITWVGDAHFDGPVFITETLDVTAETTLRAPTTVLADLNVTGGGKVKVGTAMTLDPSVSAGALVFSNGAQVFTSGSTIQMFKGSRAVSISDSEIVMTDGARTVRISSAGIALLGLGTYGRTTVTPNVPVGTLMGNATTGVVTRAV